MIKDFFEDFKRYSMFEIRHRADDEENNRNV
jgi:hypothetical protein